MGVPPGAWILDTWSAKMLSLPDTCRKMSIPYRLDATSKAASRTMRLTAADADDPFSNAPSADGESDLVVAFLRPSDQHRSHVLMGAARAPRMYLVPTMIPAGFV